MALTKEQVTELKAQLKEQIKNLPPEQQAAAEKQIDEMSSGALETMLQQQQSQNPQQQGDGKIYRAIISGSLPSNKIQENSDALAVLEIKPISKGHIIIIPKTPVEKPENLSPETLSLSKEISDLIKEKLNAKDTRIETNLAFGEIIMNVIPIYDKPLDLKSPRYDATEKELSEVLEILYVKPKPKTINLDKPKPKRKKVIKLKRKVP